MIVEFSGLAGSGKTTMMRACAKTLKSRSIDVLSLREALRRAMNAENVRDFPYKQGIVAYGSVHYASLFPNTYRHLTLFAEKSPLPTFWNLYLMSNYYFTHTDPARPDFVLNDEGLVQRGGVYFGHLEQHDMMGDYIKSLDPSLVLIVLDISIEDSMARMKGRKKGVPAPYRHAPLEMISEQKESLDAIYIHWENAKRPILRLKGTEPIEDNIERVCEFFSQLES